jgi:hypothetical protein
MLNLLAASLLASGVLLQYPELGPTYYPNAPVDPTQREQYEYQQRQRRINEGPTQLQQEQKAYEQRQRRIWCADHPGTC